MYKELLIAAAQQAKKPGAKARGILEEKTSLRASSALRDKLKHAVQTANEGKQVSQREQRHGPQRIPFFNAFLSLSLFKKQKLVEESPDCESTIV